MGTGKTVVVGTRASALARRQTGEVIERLQRHHPRETFVVRDITTRGDARRERPIAALGVGVFVKELEVALLNREIDVAVHSFKDLPTQLTDGLVITAITEREDVRDVLVSRWNRPLAGLPHGARIGTGSPRRAAQLRALRPDLRIVPIRGNVDTRLQKAMTQELDGVILAAAGLARLGLTDSVTEYLSLEISLPAPGQGALAVEVRADDEEMARLVRCADHQRTRLAVTAEKAFLEAFGGGCRVPMGAYGQVAGQSLRLRGFIALEDGSRLLRSEVAGSAGAPEEVGRSLAQRLLEMGAGELVRGGG